MGILQPGFNSIKLSLALSFGVCKGGKRVTDFKKVMALRNPFRKEGEVRKDAKCDRKTKTSYWGNHHL
jgi:hypothetical protein